MANSESKEIQLTGQIKAGLLFLLILFGSFKYHSNNKDLSRAVNKKKDLQRSTVLLNNRSQTIPLKDLAHRTIASINAGNSYATDFDNMLRNYAPVSSFTMGTLNTDELRTFSTLIIQVTSQSLGNPATLTFIREAQKTKEVIIAGSGPVAALGMLDSYATPLVWSPEQTAGSSGYIAQLIFGGEAAEGSLTDSISPNYRAGSGSFTSKIRLKYTTPEEAGISSARLSRIDDIVNEAIRGHATPGAVVMVVKDGNVIFDKAYGSHTYDGETPTRVSDIYDLASVTKVAATTIAAMKLYEEQKLDLNSGIGNYLPDVSNTNKNNIPVRDVMLHQAGFVNLDFFSYVKPQDHSSDSSFFFPVKVTNNYYLRRNYYQDVMWQKMLKTPLPTRGQYVYSDISMYMMKEIIERQAGMPLDKFVMDEFYTGLGMRTAGFNPLTRFDKDEIVPTERDSYFRKTLLQGYVNDAGASLAGGVSGHAGLFSSANDLAILNQMLLNGGSYGGVEYLKPETVDLFTSSQSNVSRRGLGFDRGNGTGYPSSLAPVNTFGHTGYTGTCVWVDPKQKLIYIFLSNRVYPSAGNKLNSMRIRPRIQDVIYEAIEEGRRNYAGLGN